MAKRELWMFLLLLAGMMFLPARARGQAVTATLVGTITDTSGAIIPNASVSITNQGTTVVTNTTSNESGNFTFTFLPPGTYTVTVTAPGFQKKVTSGVSVPVNTTTRIDTSMSAGSTSETITVTDQAPLLQTDRADVSAQIEARQVSELPVGNG